MFTRKLTTKAYAASFLKFQRTLSTKIPPFPTITSCPPPTCDCAPTPEMPEGFDIDRKTTLNGLISNYAQQVLVCTGKTDWPSRIEEDNSGDNLAADLRELLGRGGIFSDVSGGRRSARCCSG